ncbi:SWPV1-134 [Shearwaterpox virus]|uniref:SWPV1-134 n=1 Tax=Shearwaterpox virus TaxID=1974596 RepID=A0A1V0S7X2_CNPV|nr:SWPV1-134 [Shearwaterpox virus]
MEEELYKLMFFSSDDEIISKIKKYVHEYKEENEYSLYRNIPLHYAVCARRVTIVEHLLKSGYDPNVMDNMGYYPIQLICIPLHTKKLPVNTETYNLIKRYLNLVRDHDKFTTSLSIPIAREILSGNINIYKNRILDMMEKIVSDELYIADMLITYGAILNNSSAGMTALHYAAEYGNLYIIRLLIIYGADVTLKTSLGDSILVCATKSNNITIIKEICSYLSNFKDDFNRMIKIAYHYNTNTLSFLKMLGFDIKSVDDLGKTVLHYACSAKTEDTKKLRILLNEGIDVNLVDNEGFTALHLAIKSSYSKTVKILLQHGADTNINTKNNETVFYLAVKSRSVEIITEVIQYYNDYINCKDILADVTVSSDLKMISTLLDIGFNVNDIYYNNSSLLHLAVIFGTPDTVKLLLEYGADPNITDKYGTTPLESALIMWHIPNKKRIEFSKLMTIDLVFKQHEHSIHYSLPSVKNQIRPFNKNMHIIETNTYLKKIKEYCELEIENMKSVSLNNKNSLYSLIMDTNPVTILEDNPSFKQFIRNSLNGFPIYRKRIEKFITNTFLSYI